jgi:DNA-binding response OmpR family regulator
MQHAVHTVLVVDDHQDTAEMLAEFLGEAGFHAQIATSALEALRVYETLRPALVITDEGLGTMTGSDLLRVLRRKYGAAVGRALFLTGDPDAVTALPGDVVLEKPIGLDALIAAIYSILGQPPAAQNSY